MELVDREEERRELRRQAASPPSLVFVRGRRRVGKSFLVSAALDTHRVVSYQADEQNERAQLAGFAREAAELAGVPGLHFATWDDALAFVGATARTAPLVVVLDEFQYLCASRPALPSIVQRHWDGWQRDGTPLTLVLVGSALSFMEGLLAQGSPLYGRATYRPLLLPFDHVDASAFAPAGSSPAALVQRFAMLGGTPQYLAWAHGRPAERAVRDLMLRKGGPLHDEPLQLLRGEDAIREPRHYFGALAAVASGQTRTGQVSSWLGMEGSNTSKVLARLQELAYLEAVEPLVPRERRARAYWRIVDPFFRFWFRFAFPNRSRLDRGAADAVWRDIVRDLDGHTGSVFEDCCRAWFSRRSGLDESSTAKRVGRWWSRDGQAEIDIVAMDGRRYTFLGSCKWHRGLVGTAALDDLYAHRALLGPSGAQATLALFARRGFSRAAAERAKREGVRLFTAEDLF